MRGVRLAKAQRKAALHLRSTASLSETPRAASLHDCTLHSPLFTSAAALQRHKELDGEIPCLSHFSPHYYLTLHIASHPQSHIGASISSM